MSITIRSFVINFLISCFQFIMSPFHKIDWVMCFIKVYYFPPNIDVSPTGTFFEASKFTYVIQDVIIVT